MSAIIIEIARLALHLIGAAVGGMVGFEFGLGFGVLFFYFGKYLIFPARIADKVNNGLIWTSIMALTTCAGAYIGWYIPNMIANLM